MGTLIFIEEFRKRRCVEALLAHIGLPSYCDDCGDESGDPLLDTTDILFEDAQPLLPTTSAPVLAQILTFPLRAADGEDDVAPRKSPRRAQARRAPRE